MKVNLKITGVTPENYYTISGIYKLYETYGIPLDIIVDFFFLRGYIIDLEAFRQDCILAGMNDKSITIKIERIVDELKTLIKEKNYSLLHQR
jgi:alanyl-tRNA synthetase